MVMPWRRGVHAERVDIPVSPETCWRWCLLTEKQIKSAARDEVLKRTLKMKPTPHQAPASKGLKNLKAKKPKNLNRN